MSNKPLSKVLEKKIEQHVVDLAKRRGGVAIKLKFVGERGAPDRLVLLDHGWSMFLEVKRPVGGVISANQRRWHRTIGNLGHRVAFVSTVDEVNDIFMSYDMFVTRLIVGGRA